MTSAKTARILIAEDNDTMRDVLEECLRALGYAVVSAPSAETALALLDTAPPDLVLTDVHMDGMTGIELCRRIKADPRFELTPVVIITGVANPATRVEARAAGADDFFAKPVDFLQLQARVAALLRTKSLVDQLGRAEDVIASLGLPRASAIGILRREAETCAWDPRVVSALVAILEDLDAGDRGGPDRSDRPNGTDVDAEIVDFAPPLGWAWSAATADGLVTATSTATEGSVLTATRREA